MGAYSAALSSILSAHPYPGNAITGREAGKGFPSLAGFAFLGGEILRRVRTANSQATRRVARFRILPGVRKARDYGPAFPLRPRFALPSLRGIGAN